MKLLHVVTALAVVSLPACGSDGLSGPGGNDAPGFVGSYDLRSINGDILPVTVLETLGERVEIVDGNLLIRDDGNFVLDAAVRVTADGQSETISDVTTGSWFLSANRLTLDYDVSGLCTDSATWLGDRITIEEDCDLGWRWIYEK
jgi:hypothetical protein